jgi:hypothetical protein
LNQYKDLFFYNTALVGDDIGKALKYVGDNYSRDENYDLILDENDEPILIN